MTDSIETHVAWCRRQAAAARSTITVLPPEEQACALVGGRLERTADLWDRLADEAEAYLADRDRAHAGTGLF